MSEVACSDVKDTAELFRESLGSIITSLKIPLSKVGVLQRPVTATMELRDAEIPEAGDFCLRCSITGDNDAKPESWKEIG